MSINPLIRGMGSYAPHPLPKRKRSVPRGIYIALYEDSQGIKFVFKLRFFKLNIDKVKILKENVIESVKGNVLGDPVELTEVPTGKVIEPEDMYKEAERMKLIEPEDM